MKLLTEALDANVARCGDDLALRFLTTGDMDGPVVELTFEEFQRRALRVAEFLSNALEPGDRALLLYEEGVEFIVAMYGCFYAGVIAVPTYPPDPGRIHRTLPRLEAISVDAGARAVLTTADILGAAEPLCGQVPGLRSLRWLGTDRALPWSGEYHPVMSTGEDIAYLQYTSGSTGSPKGVMVSHGNLVHTCDDFLDRWAYRPGVHQVSWLPGFHDLGLIWGLLVPLYGGHSCTFMRPVAFLQRPARWLEALDRTGAAYSAAPNFAFELCVRKVSDAEVQALDLSKVEALMNAAEPIRSSTLRAFTEKFEACGFRSEAMCPGYGLAEATLPVSLSSMVTGAPRIVPVVPEELEQGRVVVAEEGSAAVAIGCGPPTGETEVAIVDEATLVRVPPDCVGEIWVRGPVVARGYWRREEATEETFAALIEGEGEPRWLRTGDLGFVRDGEVFVTGRSKDLLILHGRNVYPQDLEVVAEGLHVALRPGCSAAFALEVAGVERAGIVLEVDSGKLDDSPEQLIDSIRRTLAEEFDVQVHDVALIEPRAIFKTSSGKIQRSRTRSALLDGELSTLARWTGGVPEEGAVEVSPPELDSLTTLAQMEGFVWDLLRAQPQLGVGVEPRLEDSFRDLGLNSVIAVELSGQLGDVLNQAFPPTLLFEFPSPRKLAARLMGDEGVLESLAIGEGLRARRLRDALQKAMADSGLGAAELPDEEDFLAFLRGESSPGLSKLNLRGPYEGIKRMIPRWLEFLSESFDVSRALVYTWSAGGQACTVQYLDEGRLVSERSTGGEAEESFSAALLASPENEVVFTAKTPPVHRFTVPYSSGLIFGFRRGDALVGAVQLLHQEANAFDDGDASLLGALCRQVGPALVAVAELVEGGVDPEGERDLASLTATIIRESSLEHFVSEVLETGNRLIGAEVSALYLYDEDTGELYGVEEEGPAAGAMKRLQAHENLYLQALEEGTLRWVSGEEAPSSLEGADPGLRNLLCAPILNHDHRLGVLVFANRGEEDPGEWERGVLSRLERRVVVGINTLPLIARMHLPFFRSLHELEEVAPPRASASLDRAEPIAVVGIGCRYPGGIVDERSFWEVLAGERDVIREVPPERWSIDDLYNPDPDNEGTMVTRCGGFLRGIEEFDAPFFGISAREAERLDPQQRLVLECTWEGLENAGIIPKSLMGTPTGVFMGLIYQEYAARVPDLEGVDGYTLTGSTASVASGRVSYLLGLEGPSLTVDTACSSSLMALHLACESLARGECNLAVAGGVTVMLTPTPFVGFSRLKGLAPDGRCKSFSAEADGTAWAEGCGVLVLKRLADAVAEGDTVVGVIRGSAVNQDGRSNGLTAPSGPAQRGVVRSALDRAGVLPQEVDYVECHGTGTPLGDPIEVLALDAALGRERDPKSPLWIGSVKSNLGHTQAAAGIAGVIKTLLALRHQEIPSSLHCEEPSPHIPWERSPLVVANHPVPWPGGSRPRIGGVSSFGISGTNVHVVLEEPPPRKEDAGGERSVVAPLVLSGRGEESLRGQACRWAEWLEEVPQKEWGDLVYSSAVFKSHFETRAAITADGPEAAIEALDALAKGESHVDLLEPAPRTSPVLAFLFTGQGSQFAGMGKELYETLPAFREILDRIFALFDQHREVPLKEVLFSEDGGPRLAETENAQAALFCLGVGLAELWNSWGVEPDLVLGHSVGEVAAACVAGVFSLEDAVLLVVARGRLMQGCESTGAMVSVEGTEEEVRAALAGAPGAVDVAAVNGPAQVVISGDAAGVLEVARGFEEIGRKTKRLEVSHAFHSAHMEPMLEEFREVVSTLTFNAPQKGLVSNLTGAQIFEAEVCTPDYWVSHVREAVRFKDGMESLSRLGARTFVECGPRGVLLGMAAGFLNEDSLVFAPCLRTGRGERESIAGVSGLFYTQGRELNWPAVFADAGVTRVTLPSYIFQRSRHWLEAPKTERRSPDGADRELWSAVRAGETEALATMLGIEGEQLEPLVPLLAAWRSRSDREGELSSWLYPERWERCVSSDRGSSDVSGRWLILESSQSSEVGDLAASAFVELGGEALRLVGAPPREDLARGITELGEDLRGILLFPGDSVGGEGDPFDGDPGLNLTLVTLQALGDAGTRAPLWVVTRGAVSTGDGDPVTNPLQAQVWGLGRVASLEHPYRFGGVIDLPAEMTPSCGRSLVEFVGSGGDEDQVALRGEGVLARRLGRCLNEFHAPPWKPRGTVLITGGTGALGMHLARRLSEEGAERLVLTSRRGLDAPGAVELKEALERGGTAVEIRTCDCASEGDVVALVESLVEESPPLLGVFHLAGEMGFAELSALDVADLKRECAAKVGGAVALHRGLGDHRVEVFVLYGSIAGLWGAGGQGAYSAANAGLEGIARYRRGKGMPGTVVHWGPWAGEGLLGANADHDGHLRKRGLLPMEADKALGGLELALRCDLPAVGVVKVDWSRFAPVFALSRARPLFEGVPEATEALEVNALEHGEPEGAAGGDEFRESLSALSDSGRRDLVRALIAEETAAVLGQRDPSGLNVETGFIDLGFDSLLAVELRRRLEKRCGVRLPATLVFDHPTIELAADWLLETALDAPRGSPEVAPAETARRASDERLAIVGVGLRFPGGAEDLESFWDLLVEGVEPQSEIPADRFSIDDYYDPSPEVKGTSYVRRGAFLSDVTSFDAAFFGISPREAAPLDPQHRLLLEGAWTALENAGINPEELRGTSTGVFVGIGPNEYGEYRGRGAEGGDAYDVMGTQTSFSAGRVAYHLGLEGPAISVDTACSSSLVALHLAGEALLHHRCDFALAAGVQVLVNPASFVLLSRTRALSADGLCKTFSSEADGYGRGEGVGVLVMMRESDARRRGARILGLVRGSAVNHDGASSGITAPNGTSQQKVLRAALRDAGLVPGDVDVVECHGTGTTLGDPVEIQALGAVYGVNRGGDSPLRIGTVKTNIGHLESAAGVAGVIKVLAAFAREAIPPSLHTHPRNSHIDWDALPVEVVDELSPWPRSPEGRVRRAGVSAFGLSGTNAHVLLEEPAEDSQEEISTRGPAPPMVPLVLSAASEEALRIQAGRWERWLGRNPGVPFGDILYTASVGRKAMDFRAVMNVGTVSEARAALGELESGGAEGRVYTSVEAGGKTGLLLTGQGSARVGMGRGLYEEVPLFRSALEEMSDAVSAHLEVPLLEVLFAEPDSPEARLLEETRYAQPALFAFEVALAGVWLAAGVTPDYLLGHSVGQLTAAYLAGVWSREDAAKLVCARGELMQGCSSAGAMASLGIPESAARALVSEHGGGVEIAGVNGPAQSVISGDRAAVEALVQAASERGERATLLAVSHAFHSAHMEPMLERFREVAGECTYHRPRISVVSNQNGEVGSADELMSPDYWVAHVRGAVHFEAGMRTLESRGVTTLIEVGPLGVLCAMGAECVSQSEIDLIPSHRRNQDEVEALRGALGRVFSGGARLDWAPFFANADAQVAGLPPCAFTRQRYWLPPSGTASVGSEIAHPMFTGSNPVAGSGTVVFTGRLAAESPPWVRDHGVGERLILPGTGLMELMLGAAGETGGAWSLRDVVLSAPLEIPGEGEVRFQVVFDPGERGASGTLKIYSAGAEATWSLHAEGTLEGVAPGAPASLPVPSGEGVTVEDLYPNLGDLGLTFGPSFEVLEEARRCGEDLWVRVALPPARAEEAARYALHPALLDGAFHGVFLGMSDAGSDAGLFLPVEVARLTVWRSGASEVWAQLGPVSAVGESLRVDAVLWDLEGDPVASVEGLTLRRADPSALGRPVSPSVSDLRFLVQWDSHPVRSEPVSGAWGLWGEQPEKVDAVRAALREAGVPVEVLPEISVERTAGLVGVLCLWESVWEPDEACASAVLKGITLVQEFNQERLAWVWVTEGAVGTRPMEPLPGLSSAGLWGFGRGARAENPALSLKLVDLGHFETGVALLARSMGLAEEEVAIRDGEILTPRLVRAPASLHFPTESEWRVEVVKKGRLDRFEVVPTASVVGEGQVRIRVEAAGLNFRDVLNALGMVEIPWLGLELAGTVVEVGASVIGLEIGDRVFGLGEATFASSALADARYVIELPEGLTIKEAATLPLAFLTAFYALYDLADLKRHQRVLIHAATGGVGMAAVQLAQLKGAEVFGTASAPKWSALGELGVAEDHIASSRELGFGERFREVAGGAGMDVVLNSLTEGFIDESLELLGPGGWFLEMGKTDLRSGEWLAEHHRGVEYAAFDLFDLAPHRIQEMLGEIVAGFTRGELRPLRFRSFSLDQISEVFRTMARAGHIGKLVLTPPEQRPLPAARTLLVTGGLGALGREVAKWMVRTEPGDNLVLTSRRGADTEEAREFVEALRAEGGRVSVEACDVSDEEQVKRLLFGLPVEFPLGGIVHAAGVIEDGMISTLSGGQVARVLAPKVSGAWNLHWLTQGAELDFFVLFSSVSGVLGNPGQAHYAAANTFMDGLAQHRQSMGLPALAIAWGPWAGKGMAAALGDADKGRMARGGLGTLTVAQGLELLDGAMREEGAQLLGMSLDLKRLERGARSGVGELPGLYRDLVSGGTSGTALRSARGKIEAMPAAEREAGLLEMVRGEVAQVLGLSAGRDVNPGLSLKDLGVDSLMAVELRNRLNVLLDLRLSATVIFDYPHVRALTGFLFEGFAQGEDPEREHDDILLEETLVDLHGSEGEDTDLSGAGEADPLTDLDDEEFLKHALDLLESGGEDE